MKSTPSQMLLNNSREQVLAEDVEWARSMWSRFRGLMGRRAMVPNGALVLDPTNGIHMFFMRFSLDAVFVDREWKVLHIAHDIKPWRVSRVILRSKRVIELPSGTCRRTGTCKGDVLAVVESPKDQQAPAA